MDYNNKIDIHGGNVYKISTNKGVDICDIIDFSANINPLGISKMGEVAIKEANNLLGYYPDFEYNKLRHSIAKHHNIPSEWVIVSNGAIEALFLFVRATMPQSAVVAVPSFVEYRRAIESVGGKYRPLYRENNKFSLSLDKLNQMLKQRADLLILCNPNNPTGTLISKDYIDSVLKITDNFGVWTLIDEAFMDFAQILGASSVVSQFREGMRVASMHSITKFFAVPGIRMGYLICPNHYMRKQIQKVSYPWSVNIYAQEFVKNVLNDYDYIENTKKWFVNERKFLYESLQKIKNIYVYDSYANYFMFKYEGNLNLRDKLLDKNIIIRDCQNFDGLNSGYYRVAIKSHEHNKILLKEIDKL